MSDGSQSIVFLSLGSNIEPEKNLPEAVRLLGQAVDVMKVSSVWESEPVGFLDQPSFCNAAVLVRTGFVASQLKLEVLRSIEDVLLRIRDPNNKNGPRTIDIDIAFYGDQVIDKEGVKIPDPEIESRAFLVVPLAELAPDFVHPVSKLSLQDIAGKVEGRDRLIPRSGIQLESGL